MVVHTVTAWLEETSQHYPDNLALHDESLSLTYNAYRQQVLAVARAVMQLHLRSVPIAVYLEKSVQYLVSFYGIAYSGNFYSPIDLELPMARIQKMLSILDPALVITRKSLKSSFDSTGYAGPYLFLEDIVPQNDDADIVLPLQSSIVGDDLLYVLFTSGSTGIPKGVAITHRSVINYIDWAVATFDFSAEDSFGNQAPFYFDNSILDIYCSAYTGASLHIISPNLFAQPVLLLKYLKDHQISTIFWVPSALIGPAKLKAFRTVDLTSSLKRVLFCGEVMSTKQLNVWRTYLPNVLYANLYGPTEITDACSCYIVDRMFSDTEPLPIGKPIDNVEILLLDDAGNPVSEGEIGEIGVQGVCLSPGYYRNPEKTAQVFVPSPTSPGERIYKTGDLAQYNERGELMYLSRKDFQIKHFGRRIELGELETIADSLLKVAKSCALYHQERHKIFLFIELENGSDTDTQDIMHRLSIELPKYMVPNKILIIDKMPINNNGKIDRVALMEYLK